MPRLAVLSLAWLAALPACKDTPSYRLRWTLGPDDDVADLAITRAFQCSQYGVGAVRVRAIDALGFTANEDIHPCFPEGFEDSDEKAEGPELRPGAYALEVRGVQRDLKEWIDTSPDEAKPDAECVPGAENLGCAREDLVCDCQEFEAVEDETYSGFDDFRLIAPLDCVDGIDNDNDGLVDRQDPGCAGAEAADGDCDDGIDNDEDGAIDGDDSGCVGSEADDVSVVQFTLRVTLFDENPGATCTGVGLTRLHLTATPEGGEPFAIASVQCRAGDTLFFSAELPDTGGPLTIEIEGRNASGDPITAKLPLEDTVAPGSDAIIDLDIDFGPEDFTPAIVTYGSFFAVFADYPEPDPAVDCGGEPATLFIPELSLVLFDLAGAPVTGATLRNGGAPLDGTPLACEPGLLHTQDLTWGGYRLAAEALAADGTVCFRSASGGGLLAPESPVTIELDPVLVGDALPAACFACDGEGGCS